MTGWREDWAREPALEDGKLYGRGGADDGYAVFASLCGHRRIAGAGARTRAASA